MLNRVASLFRRRAFNIESLTVGRTEQAGISRMTVVVDTDEYGRGGSRPTSTSWCRCGASRTSAQRPTDRRATWRSSRSPRPATCARRSCSSSTSTARAVVDVSPESLVIEATGTEDKIDSLLEVLRPYGVVEMVRTGLRGDGAGHRAAAVRRPSRASVADHDNWATIRCKSRRA